MLLLRKMDPSNRWSIAPMQNGFSKTLSFCLSLGIFPLNFEVFTWSFKFFLEFWGIVCLIFELFFLRFSYSFKKPIPKNLDLENSLDLGTGDADTEAVL